MEAVSASALDVIKMYMKQRNSSAQARPGTRSVSTARIVRKVWTATRCRTKEAKFTVGRATARISDRKGLVMATACRTLENN